MAASQPPQNPDTPVDPGATSHSAPQPATGHIALAFHPHLAIPQLGDQPVGSSIFLMQI